MIKWFVFCFVCVLLLPLTAIQAQNEIVDVQSVEAAFWPDYDRPAVLVLITGTLPPDTPLPATVSLPLPAEAELNAVARISSDNVMIDDIEHDTLDGRLTLTTPDPRFRVEYYQPYVTDANEHTFTFTWTADNITVAQFSAVVQQPAAATSLVTEPAAVATAPGADGLTYHTLSPQTVPAGQPISLRISYTMSSPTLTTALLNRTDVTETAPSPTTTSRNWPLLLAVVGGTLVVAALGWQLATRPAGRKRPRPKARGRSAPVVAQSRKNRPTAARFCHECGEPALQADRFCRHCGTRLKGR